MYLFKTLINCTIFIIQIKYIKNKIFKKNYKIECPYGYRKFYFFIKKKKKKTEREVKNTSTVTFYLFIYLFNNYF